MVFLLVAHGILALLLVVIVLVQRSDTSGLSGLSGGDQSGMFAPRSTANLLTRVTAVLATIFMISALALSWLTAQQSKPDSLFDAPQEQVAPAPVEELTPPVSDSGDESLPSLPPVESDP